jgi:hypothetical protein
MTRRSLTRLTQSRVYVLLHFYGLLTICQQVFDELCAARCSELAEFTADIYRIRSFAKPLTKKDIDRAIDEREGEQTRVWESIRSNITGMELPAVVAKSIAEAMSAAAKRKDDKVVQGENLPSKVRRLLEYTSFNWRAIVARSRSREYALIARCVIISLYRSQLLLRRLKHTSIALLRDRIRKVLASCTDPIYVNGQPLYTWEFLDGIAPDVSTIPALQKGSYLGRMERIERRRLPAMQQKELKTICAAITKSPLAQFSREEGSDAGLERNVRHALCHLVVTLAGNAVRQRRRLKGNKEKIDVLKDSSVRDALAKVSLPKSKSDEKYLLGKLFCWIVKTNTQLTSLPEWKHINDVDIATTREKAMDSDASYEMPDSDDGEMSVETGEQSDGDESESAVETEDERPLALKTSPKKTGTAGKEERAPPKDAGKGKAKSAPEEDPATEDVPTTAPRKAPPKNVYTSRTHISRSSYACS